MGKFITWMKAYMRYRIDIRKLNKKAKNVRYKVKHHERDKQKKDIDIMFKYLDMMENVLYLEKLGVKEFEARDLIASTESTLLANYYTARASDILDEIVDE